MAVPLYYIPLPNYEKAVKEVNTMGVKNVKCFNKRKHLAYEAIWLNFSC